MNKRILLFSVYIFMTCLLEANLINIPSDYLTIQAGIEAAADADTVLVAPGTYNESLNFNGKAITVASYYLTAVDSSYIDNTILDGNNSNRLVTFSNSEDSTSVLTGFTLINGADGTGGGIMCNSASPTLDHLLIKDCTAIKGSALYCYDASPKISNCTITSNLATNNGAIYVEVSSNPDLINTILWDNSPEQIFISQEEFLTIREIPDITVTEAHNNGALFDLDNYILSSYPIEDLEISYSASFISLEGEVSIDDDFFLIVDFFPELDLAYHVQNGVTVELMVEYNGITQEQSFTCNYQPEATALQGTVYDVWTNEWLDGIAFDGNFLSIRLNEEQSAFLAFFTPEEGAILELTKEGYHTSQRYFILEDDIILQLNLMPQFYDDAYGGDYVMDGLTRVFRQGHPGGALTRWIVNPIFCVDLNETLGYSPDSNDIDMVEQTLAYIPEFTNYFVNPYEEGHFVMTDDGTCNPWVSSDLGKVTVNWDTGLLGGGAHHEDHTTNGLIVIGANVIMGNVAGPGTYNQEFFQALGASQDIDSHYLDYFDVEFWPLGESTFCDQIPNCARPDFPTDFDNAIGRFAYSREPGNLAPDTAYLIANPSTNRSNYTEVRNFWSSYDENGVKRKYCRLMGYAKKGMVKSSDEILAEVPSDGVLEKYPISNKVMDLTPVDPTTLGRVDLFLNSIPSNIEYDLNGNELSLIWDTLESTDFRSKVLERERVNLYISRNDQPFRLINDDVLDSYQLTLDKPGLYRFYVNAEYRENHLSLCSEVLEIAYKVDAPVYYKKLCSKSKPALKAVRNESKIALNWEVLQTGDYPKNGQVFHMNYDESILYMSLNGDEYKEIYRGYMPEYVVPVEELGDYRFMVKAAYNGCQITPESNFVYLRLAEDPPEHGLKQVYPGSDEDKEIRTLRDRELDLSSVAISYSTIQGGESGIVTGPLAEVHWLDGNLEDDPMLLDDKHLSEDSPCIDAGSPDSPLDPNGTIIEMGAFYYPDLYIEVEQLLPEPGELNIAEGDSISFQISATDPDGNPLDYNWSLDEAIVGTESNFTYTTDDQSQGTHSISLQVTDNFERGERNTLEYAWSVIVEDVSSSPDDQIPAVTAIYQNVPNPFNPNTIIRFDLSKESKVQLEIYNIKGQKVKTLVNSRLEAGTHTYNWNGVDSNSRSVASGIYFYRFKSDELDRVYKMVVLK